MRTYNADMPAGIVMLAIIAGFAIGIWLTAGILRSLLVGLVVPDPILRVVIPFLLRSK